MSDNIIEADFQQKIEVDGEVAAKDACLKLQPIFQELVSTLEIEDLRFALAQMAGRCLHEMMCACGNTDRFVPALNFVLLQAHHDASVHEEVEDEREYIHASLRQKGEKKPRKVLRRLKLIVLDDEEDAP